MYQVDMQRRNRNELDLVSVLEVLTQSDRPHVSVPLSRKRLGSQNHNTGRE